MRASFASDRSGSLASHAPHARTAPRAADARRPGREAGAARSRADGQGVSARRARSREGARPNAIEQAGLRVQRRSPVYTPLWLEPPKPEQLTSAPRYKERACYVCKQPFAKVHRYYDSMCEPCGDFNYAKREQSADLSGHYALVTGARVKIGYQAALKLLRAGAHVIVTTRFPVDAADRYAKEPDFREFRARLQILGLDLRHTPSVDLFTRFLANGCRGSTTFSTMRARRCGGRRVLSASARGKPPPRFRQPARRARGSR